MLLERRSCSPTTFPIQILSQFLPNFSNSNYHKISFFHARGLKPGHFDIFNMLFQFWYFLIYEKKVTWWPSCKGQRTSCNVLAVTHLHISWLFHYTCIPGYTRICKTRPSSRTVHIHRYCYLSYIHLYLWRNKLCKACSLLAQKPQHKQKPNQINPGESKENNTFWSLCLHSV